jgi:hypothetical protein
MMAKWRVVSGYHTVVIHIKALSYLSAHGILFLERQRRIDWLQCTAARDTIKPAPAYHRRLTFRYDILQCLSPAWQFNELVQVSMHRPVVFTRTMQFTHTSLPVSVMKVLEWERRPALYDIAVWYARLSPV